MVSRSNKFASYWIKDIQEHVKERSQEQREEWLSYKESFVHVFSNWKQNIGNKTILHQILNRGIFNTFFSKQGPWWVQWGGVGCGSHT